MIAIRLACVFALICVLSVEASARGPGCDYDQTAYRQSIQSGYDIAEPYGEAEREKWASRDIVLHVPVCINNIDPIIETISLDCTLGFSEEVSLRQGYPLAYNDTSFASDTRWIFSRDLTGADLTAPYAFDEVYTFYFDLEHRGLVEHVSRARCHITLKSENESISYDPLSPEHAPEDHEDELYRVAAPGSEFRNYITYNNIRTVERNP